MGDAVPARRELFRPRFYLRYGVLVAVAFWIGVFFELVALDGAPNRAFLGTAFFIALFTVLGVFYNNNSIELTGEGLLVRGMLSLRLVPYSDILRVDVDDGLLQTSYTLLSRAGFVSFTSTFRGHRRLAALIVERAGLDRRR